MTSAFSPSAGLAGGGNSISGLNMLSSLSATPTNLNSLLSSVPSPAYNPTVGMQPSNYVPSMGMPYQIGVGITTAPTPPAPYGTPSTGVQQPTIAGNNLNNPANTALSQSVQIPGPNGQTETILSVSPKNTDRLKAFLQYYYEITPEAFQEDFALFNEMMDEAEEKAAKQKQEQKRKNMMGAVSKAAGLEDIPFTVEPEEKEEGSIIEENKHPSLEHTKIVSDASIAGGQAAKAKNIANQLKRRGRPKIIKEEE